MKATIGTQVMITGISADSPFDVFNGRTGVVTAHPGSKFSFVTVRLAFPVTADEIELAFGPNGTIEDVTGDETGQDVDFLAKHLVIAPAVVDADGDTTRGFVLVALAEIMSMARRHGHRPGMEIWNIARDMISPRRLREELDPCIVTPEDARAWVHHRTATDRWGF